MPQLNLTKRQAEVDSRAKAARLPSTCVTYKVKKALIDLAERKGVTVAEAHRWVVEAGLKSFDVNVRVNDPRTPRSVTSRFAQFNDETHLAGDNSTAVRTREARQARAGYNILDDLTEGDYVSPEERMVEMVRKSGALTKIPTDLLIPNTPAPPAEAVTPEEDDLEQSE